MWMAVHSSSKVMQCRSSSSITTQIHSPVQNVNHLFASELVFVTVLSHCRWCWCSSSFSSSVIASFCSRELASSISRNSSSDHSTSPGEGKRKLAQHVVS